MSNITACNMTVTLHRKWLVNNIESKVLALMASLVKLRQNNQMQLCTEEYVPKPKVAVQYLYFKMYVQHTSVCACYYHIQQLSVKQFKSKIRWQHQLQKIFCQHTKFQLQSYVSFLRCRLMKQVI